MNKGFCCKIWSVHMLCALMFMCIHCALRGKETAAVLKFGVSRSDVEMSFGKALTTEGMIVAEAGVYEFSFYNDRIFRIKLVAADSKFMELAPFSDSWKNMQSLDGRHIVAGMTKANLLEYLARWEKRLISLGGRRVVRLPLRDREVLIREIVDSGSNTIYVNMGPSRQGRGGAMWNDLWSFSFATRLDGFDGDINAAPLREVVVSCDGVRGGGE